MGGRGVAPVVDGDPGGVMEHIRFVVDEADLSFFNLESPITSRPMNDESQLDLRADVVLAELAAGAGFDFAGLANNHSLDAGLAGLEDTRRAVAAAGMTAVGLIGQPVHVDLGGLTLAVFAFDVTGTGDGSVVARWDEESAVPLIEQAVTTADLVVVGLHGGQEYLRQADPTMSAIAGLLAATGVDVVWGHGPHVSHPIRLDGRSVVATSLGNALFDQAGTSTNVGSVLEVLATPTGVVAYREGVVDMSGLRMEFAGWNPPPGEAVWVDGGWWSPTAPLEALDVPALDQGSFDDGDLLAAGVGDLDGDGITETVVSFRRPFGETLVNQTYQGVDWIDGQGRSAHVGVYETATMTPRWVAGSVPAPVGDLAVCDGGIAVTYTGLDDEAVVGGGVWMWQTFGFVFGPDLAGPGHPACVDVDGDGSSEPAFFGR